MHRFLSVCPPVCHSTKNHWTKILTSNYFIYLSVMVAIANCNSGVKSISHVMLMAGVLSSTSSCIFSNWSHTVLTDNTSFFLIINSWHLFLTKRIKGKWKAKVKATSCLSPGLSTVLSGLLSRKVCYISSETFNRKFPLIQNDKVCQLSLFWIVFYSTCTHSKS